jgi:hypothetical protein
VLLVGYTVSVACLYWVYQGFDWADQWPRLKATDLRWVFLAVVLDILVYVCQGFRWDLLLRQLGPSSTWKSVQAIYIGLFANEVLPLRTGEVIRCFLMARWTGQRVSLVVTSALIERLLDGFWLILGFFLAGHFTKMPVVLVGASQVLMFFVVIVAGLMVAAILYHKHAKEAVAWSPWKHLLHDVVDGVHAMGRSRSFPAVTLLSLLYLALQVGPIYALMRGYGLQLGAGDALLVLVVLRIGTIVPQAPGNVGAFQALIIVGLVLLEVPRNDATGYATLLFFVVTVPLWLAGFVALLLTGMKLEEIHRAAHEEIENGRQIG